MAHPLTYSQTELMAASPYITYQKRRAGGDNGKHEGSGKRRRVTDASKDLLEVREVFLSMYAY